MARFFLEPICWTGEAALTGDEARHCARVLRAKPGDVITVFDGCGRSAEATILQVRKELIPLELGEIRQRHAPAPRIILAQAVLKGKAMEWLLQKAVELGVNAIQPLLTRYAVAQPGDEKADKWQRLVLEACKQCGQDLMPEVLTPMDFQSWIKQAPAGLKIIGSLAGNPAPLRDLVREHLAEAETATLLIGPEGDFSAQETEQALAAGFLPASLGPLVLRAETAALFGISALRYEAM
jgi:16S rRNA (uracil1498-N3)-methyltransferase